MPEEKVRFDVGLQEKKPQMHYNSRFQTLSADLFRTANSSAD